MAAGTESKIDTKLFVSTADAMGTVTKELSGCFQDYHKTLLSMRGYWQGDVSDDVKNVADAMKSSAENLLQVLGGYRKTLLEIAGIYEKTEQNVQETSKTLKFDKGMR